PAPNAAAREIEAAQFAITPPEQHRSYVIRTELQGRLQAAAAQAPPDNPRMIVLAGLEGIGRRSYLEFAAKTVFGMQFGPVIRIDETHGLEDIYLSLLDETAFPQTAEKLAEELRAFRALQQDQKCAEIASRLHILAELNHFPCFIDHGGMLD